MRYRKYGDDLIALELIYAAASSATAIPAGGAGVIKKSPSPASVVTDSAMQDLYEALRAFLLALGDDVQEKQLKHYVAFQRIKNFVCVVQLKKSFTLFLRLDPTAVELDPAFMSDVRNLGHWGTGDTKIELSTLEQFQRIQPLFQRAYAGA